MDKIQVNGVDYVPAKPKPAGTRAVVVVDRGWIFAGDVKRENGSITLSNALLVFKWESIGFNGVIEHPEKADVDLRKIADVVIPEASEIFSIPVKDSWGL